MPGRFPILAALSILTLIATGCGGMPTPAFVVSSTPVPGYGGTPLSTTAATTAALGTNATSTARAPAPTQAPSSGSSGTGTAMPTLPAPTQPPASAGGASATQSVPNTGGSGAASIMVANNATLGDILVDGSGKTLYILTTDTPNTSTCYNQCAQTWPPFIATSGSPNAVGAVSAAEIGTAIRTDGTTQVTYNGFPLYYYSGDKAPGDTNGQGTKNVWFVISPTGNPVK